MAYTKMNKSHKSNISKRINEKLTELNYTKEDVVSVIGATDYSVTRWLNGRSKPQSKNLVSLADLLDTTPEWLLNGDVTNDSDDLGSGNAQSDKHNEATATDSSSVSIDSDANNDNLEIEANPIELAIDNSDHTPAEPKEDILNTSFATKDVINKDEGETVAFILPISQPCNHDDSDADNDLGELEDMCQYRAKDMNLSMATAFAMGKKASKKDAKLKRKLAKQVLVAPEPILEVLGMIAKDEGFCNKKELRKRVKKSNKKARKLDKAAKKAVKAARKAAKHAKVEQKALDAAKKNKPPRIIILGE